MDHLTFQLTEYGCQDAILTWNGDARDCVRFSLSFHSTCYRRGKWRLLVEVLGDHEAWGCFDDQDQPMRYYHDEARAKAEAQAIAAVLVHDRMTLEPIGVK